MENFMVYTQAFLSAINKLMLYEVGGWWNIDTPGAQDGTDPHQCGYVNDADDPGGETKYGISKNNNPSVDVTNLDWDSAQDVYYNKYWLSGSCDKLPGCVGALQFDGCVNNGVSGASKTLQRAINVTADGSIGAQTIAAVNAGDPIAICNAICDLRAQYYKNIVTNNPAEVKYLNGWLRRVEEMRTFTTDPNGNF